MGERLKGPEGKEKEEKPFSWLLTEGVRGKVEFYLPEGGEDWYPFEIPEKYGILVIGGSIKGRWGYGMIAVILREEENGEVVIGNKRYSNEGVLEISGGERTVCPGNTIKFEFGQRGIITAPKIEERRDNKSQEPKDGRSLVQGRLPNF